MTSQVEAATRAGARVSVSVVICAYTDRRWLHLVDAITSVLRQRTPPAELIVVIDHNDDLLQRTRAEFPSLRCIPNTGPQGLSGARNTGVAATRGDVVAFLDDDASAEPDWLDRLTTHYDDEAVMGVGGYAEPSWQRPPPTWFPSEFNWVVGCSYTGQPTQAAPVRNLMGCNMSFRRRLLATGPLFDAALGRVGRRPAGCEETELCIRLGTRHPEGRLVYEPAARVNHVVPPDRGTVRYFLSRCYSEGRSKALVTARVGSAAALATERHYLRRAIPQGVRRGLGDVVLRRRTPGLLQAAAIAAGVAATAGGYLLGRLSASGPMSDQGRASVLALELSDLESLHSPVSGSPGAPHVAARVLVRLHGDPVGLLDVPLPPEGLRGPALLPRILDELGPQVRDHLSRDGVHDAELGAALARARGATCSSGPTLPEKPPLVSVVMPTCGRPSLLERAVRSVLDGDYPHLEVLVVDNAGEGTGTLHVVEELTRQDPRVRYVREATPGVAHARNAGAAAAVGSIVAFADDDVVTDRQWVRALVAAFADDDVTAVSGLILAAELETPAQVWVEQYGGFAKGFRRRRYDRSGAWLPGGERVDVGPIYPYTPGVYGSGASMAVRREALQRLGGFDQLLGAGAAIPAGEDIDMLLRVVLSGGVVLYEPRAIVWHTHKRDIAALRATMYVYGLGLGGVLGKQMLFSADRFTPLRRLPKGVAYALSPSSQKNAGKSGGYPLALTALELAGMARGPLRYASGRRRLSSNDSALR